MKRFFAFLLVFLLVSVAAAEGIESIPAEVDVYLTDGAFAVDNADIILTVSRDAVKKVCLGTTYQIEVPGRTVKSCSSSDKKVAAVTKTGRVTLKAAGKAKITIKLSQGKPIALTLKVIDPAVPTQVIINEGKKGTLIVGTPFQLTAVVKPATASQAVEWRSSKNAVATVDANGLVTPRKKGTVKITATAGKKTATFTATVKDKDEKIELSQYWEEDVVETASKLEGFKRVGEGRYYVTYSDGNVSLAEYREGSYKSGIGYIYVENTDRYSLFGVTVGMSRDEAKALLRAYEGKGDYYESGDYITYSPYYPDVDAWLKLSFEGGRVSAMMLNCFTDY